jgi:hypothetical protein
LNNVSVENSTCVGTNQNLVTHVTKRYTNLFLDKNI